MTLDRRNLLVLATASGALALAGCGAKEDSARAITAPPDLATIEVNVESVPTELVVDGVVEAVDQATLSAQTAGRVAEAPAEVNDHVSKGDLLVRLRAAEQVAGLGESRAALKAATARDVQARAQFDRIRDMYERKVVARATYDETVAARDSAAANLAGAISALESAREGVAYTELRAPYDGVVTSKRVQPGEVVAPGMPLVTIASLGALRVVAEVPQGVAGVVRALHDANVYVGTQRIASSKVTLFPSAEPMSATFRARVDLPDETRDLAPGTYAKVGFVTGESNRIRVPVDTVIERSELRAVYVVAPDGRVALRQVRLGSTRGDRVEVIAGLVKGERVAIDPAAAGQFVAHGAVAANE